MVDIEGNIKPFRATKEDMIDLLNQITAKMASLNNITLAVERFTFEHSTMQGVEECLRDLRLPSVANRIQIWIWGKPTVDMLFSKEYATYHVRGASDMDEARQIEDLIISFFEKHKTFRFFSPMPGTVVAMFVLFVGIWELWDYANYLRSRITLAYPSLHLFIGLVNVTFLAYILWSSLTHETPSFSFVHSIIFIGEKKSNALWALLFSIILEIIIAIVVAYLFVT